MNFDNHNKPIRGKVCPFWGYLVTGRGIGRGCNGYYGSFYANLYCHELFRINNLKILFNFEMDSKDRAAILHAGLPKPNATLNLGVHEPLRQRLVMNYNLEGMSKDERRYYISEKLKGSGSN